MIFFFVTLLCTGFLQFTEAGEIRRKPAFDLFSAPSRNIFLKNVQSISSPQAGQPPLEIVNGQPAVRGQFCYQAYLQFTNGNNYWSCGGSLINTSLILTAAHCVEGATSAIAVLGALDLRKYEEGRVIMEVESSGLKLHDRYDTNLFYNDIGVLILPKPVELNKYVCTVRLPSSTTKLSADSDNKNNYTVSGWGKTSDRTRTSKMMYVVVSGEPQDNCTSFYKKVAKYDVRYTQMCTSGAGKKGTCNGDSGGPLVQQDNAGNTSVQGIVSLGLNSCELSAPSVYTDVRYFLDWLKPFM